MAESKQLQLKRLEHQKLLAHTQIYVHEIRILEIEQEILRCKNEIINYEKVYKDMEEQINKLTLQA